MGLRAFWVHAHIFAFGCANRRGVNRYIRQAAHIHAIMIWRGAFIVKDVNSADAAKVMLRNAHIPLIESERALPRRHS